MMIKGLRDFHLRHILECGQCFRWEREPDGGYTVMAGDRVVYIKEVQDDGQRDAVDLEIDNCSREEFERFWRRYLDIDRDYQVIKEELIRRDTSAHMSAAINYGSGLRILRQDPWETVVSFIISQNNNIGRIRTCIERFCRDFGKPVCEYRGKPRYGFPEPAVVAACSVEDLADCRLGYRARYIIATAQKVMADGGRSFSEIGCQKDDAVLEYLHNLPGVGPKVANCISLFAYGRHDSFPIDVWVKKAMIELYGLPEDIQEIAAFATRRYGALGGFAQQYLFYYMREQKRNKQEILC